MARSLGGLDQVFESCSLEPEGSRLRRIGNDASRWMFTAVLGFELEAVQNPAYRLAHSYTFSSLSLFAFAPRK